MSRVNVAGRLSKGGIARAKCDNTQIGAGQPLSKTTPPGLSPLPPPLAHAHLFPSLPSTPASPARDAKIFLLIAVGCAASKQPILHPYTTDQTRLQHLNRSYQLLCRAPSSCPFSTLSRALHLSFASSVLGPFSPIGTCSWLRRSFPKLRRRHQI